MLQSSYSARKRMPWKGSRFRTWKCQHQPHHQVPGFRTPMASSKANPISHLFKLPRFILVQGLILRESCSIAKPRMLESWLVGRGKCDMRLPESAHLACQITCTSSPLASTGDGCYDLSPQRIKMGFLQYYQELFLYDPKSCKTCD
uniref:Uncharacterized protein n=1 Tax=Salix viminalis TaxID=40686 RepID=A0A6N2N7C9_SALVM